MVTTVSTTDRRDRAALVYLRHSADWQHRIVLRDGRRVYGIPSRTRPGLLHLTDGTACSCEDATRNGARCAHQIAATLYRMTQAAEMAAPTSGARLTSADGLADYVTLTEAGAEWLDAYAACNGEDMISEEDDDARAEALGLAPMGEVDCLLAGIKADHAWRDAAWAREKSDTYEVLFPA